MLRRYNQDAEFLGSLYILKSAHPDFCSVLFTADIGKRWQQFQGRAGEHVALAVTVSLDALHRYRRRSGVLRHRLLQGRRRRHQAHPQGLHPRHQGGPPRVQRSTYIVKYNICLFGRLVYSL